MLWYTPFLDPSGSFYLILYAQIYTIYAQRDVAKSTCNGNLCICP